MNDLDLEYYARMTTKRHICRMASKKRCIEEEGEGSEPKLRSGLRHPRLNSRVKGEIEFIPHDNRYNCLDSAFKEDWRIHFKFHNPSGRGDDRGVAYAQSHGLSSFENVFTESNVQKLKKNSNAPNVRSLLQAMSKMDLSEPVELLYLMGVNLTAVKDLFSIIELEKVVYDFDGEMPNKQDIFNQTFTLLSDNEVEIRKAFELLYGFPNRPIFVSICNVLNLVKTNAHEEIYQHYIQDRKTKECECLYANEAIGKMKKAVWKWDSLKLYQSNAIFINLLEFRAGVELPRKVFQDEVAAFRKRDHEDCIKALLNCSFLATSGDIVRVPFNIKNKTSQEVETDVVCSPLKKTIDITVVQQQSPIAKTRDTSVLAAAAVGSGKGSTSQCKSLRPSDAWRHRRLVYNAEGNFYNMDWMDELHVFSPDTCIENARQESEPFCLPGFVVWQIFEQLLGRILKHKRIYKEAIPYTKLFESCILVANDTVHVFVLAIKPEIFLKLTECTNLQQTLILLENVAKSGKQFCNMYIGARQSQICNIFSLARGCSTYFSQMHKIAFSST